MEYLLTPITLCIVLVLLAYLLEHIILKNEEKTRNSKVIFISMVSLIVASLSIFLISYTDTIIDALIVTGIILFSGIIMFSSILLLKKKIKFSYFLIFLIHLCVGIFITSVKSHVLIANTTWYLQSFTLFSLTYLVYKGEYKIRITAIIGMLILIRALYPWNIDLDMMQNPKIMRDRPPFSDQYQSKPVKEITEYFKIMIPSAIITNTESIGTSVKEKGVIILLTYTEVGVIKNARFRYKNGVITQE